MRISKNTIITATALLFVIIGTIAYYLYKNTNPTKNYSDELANTAELIDVDSSIFLLPSIKERLQTITNTTQSSTPVIKLQLSDTKKSMAQDIALSNTIFTNFYKDKNGINLLNEVFGVHEALPGDLPTGNNGNMYRVEMYNYAYNTSVVGIVDIVTKQIISNQIIPSSAPDIPEHLKKIAVDIAIHSNKVKTELGEVPEIKDAQMAYTKTALNKSKCERSLHLCVAPTFVKNGKALWTIVDLTDLQLVGTRWTNVGDPGPVRITERTIQNDKLSECYCKTETNITQGDWNMQYMITGSDGLRISQVKYKNNLVLVSAKLVDWHVSYSNTDGFGYSDGAGCPTFSLSAVLAIDAPRFLDLIENNTKVGFVIEQKFQSEGWPRACNYNYLQRYLFYNDGRFRMTAASIGRGCGNDGTYRPVFRLAFAGTANFSEYDGKTFQNWTQEKWSLQKETTPYTTDGSAYQINGSKYAYEIIPGRGQFNDKGRGDNAFIYITKHHSNIDEGDADLVTIGPCCNTDYQQGPEKFLNNESLNNSELIMWYVPQMRNDNTKGNEYCWAEAKIENGVYKTYSYPCHAGPMFVPKK
jgi:hypothetical protein